MLASTALMNCAGRILILAFAIVFSFATENVSHAQVFKALSSDSADHSCQVILREAKLSRLQALGRPETETDASGQSWYVFEASVDTAAAPLKTGAQVFLLYRAQQDTHWHIAPGVITTGAPSTLQRHAFRISASTLKANSASANELPPNEESLQLIPFIQSSDGRRIFDHNDHADELDSYVLDAKNNWSTKTAATVCERAGRGAAALRFLEDWTTDVRGQLHPGQSLVIEYDLSRLPQCHGSSYNGLPTWQTEAFVRFFPGGEEFSAVLNSFQSGAMASQPARFDIPENATRVQLWFKTRGRSCEGGYDSNFGKNYEFSINPSVTSSPSWAGEYQLMGNSTARCDTLVPFRNLADVEFFNVEEFDNQCLAIDAEVLVPGLTTSFASHPQMIQAQVQWKTDGSPNTTQWLNFIGRNGPNFRYRWVLPASTLRTRPWQILDFTFRFSTDGLFWLQSGRDNDNKVGVVAPRRIELKP